MKEVRRTDVEKLDGIALYECGDGPPILLLHGIGSASSIFKGQLEELCSDYHLLAWDAPGYGHSREVSRSLTMDNYAELAALCIEHRFERPAYVVGMSWGGVIASRLAWRRPELVRGLILGASTVGSGVSEAQANKMRQRVKELEANGVDDFSSARSGKLVCGGASEETKSMAASIMRNSIRPTGYASAVESMASTDHTDILTQISVPTLVIWGSEDNVTGRKAASVLLSGLQDSQGVEIAHAGHLVNFEAPAEFNRELAAFITRRESWS